MKSGDIVRFRSLRGKLKIIEDSSWSSMPDRKPLALLIEYEPWEKIATVMYNGKLFRVSASDIEKAGKKCSKCNTTEGLVLHHLTYAYKPHTEPKKILQCLCKDCHHLKHEINRILKGSPSKNMDRWRFDWRCPHEKIPEITRNIIQFAPWLLKTTRKKTLKGGINVTYHLSLVKLTQNQMTHIIRGFLDLDKLE